MKSALASFALIMVTLGACAPGLAQGVRQELKPVAFAALDANKDGKISMQEALAAPDLSDAFDKLDLNHDGFLTPAEFQAWPRALKSKDTAARDPSTAPGGSAGAQHMPPER
ncbi:MAG TPA: EF-hand domain-containing protein [Steroidobacteraceae bacterium]|nr:EF-hand domain-containing protein [Steroidobacteraceae bacterium]